MSEPAPDTSWITTTCGNCGKGDGGGEDQWHIRRGPLAGDCKSQYGPRLVVIWASLLFVGAVMAFFAFGLIHGLWEAVT